MVFVVSSAAINAGANAGAIQANIHNGNTQTYLQSVEGVNANVGTNANNVAEGTLDKSLDKSLVDNNSDTLEKMTILNK